MPEQSTEIPGSETENHGVGGSIPPLGTMTLYPQIVGDPIPELTPDEALGSGTPKPTQDKH
jgi:hypothetical protein